jgi:hypothetical protein
LSRCPKPYFATSQVPIEANTATAIADGMVVVVAPEPLVETKSGPQTALIATVARRSRRCRRAAHEDEFRVTEA